ncbi:histone-lysine n-methyltransferase setd3 isoform a [Plasmopara halstedii]|uniref:Histone-lysine n-methyltransferase setd3 isoform a n=1 Tax=Plasmopara halstedii TaxID=4781 RepID=A0A0P1ABL0_PLAHL|nr:histone-lysine n-methyltransferase setd3 isoform a [Plasmopara halstedii]CEG38301.1 histone-lysine n-methyltransferase setd3 isoform a [Plasmopara halstedii]|eukprot:XP_024574670.1 histone-lysine n-methyltransferase setd3 isoform a [Plasmopara halstedii]
MSSPVVTALLEWLEANGSVENRLNIRYLGRDEGHGVFAKQNLERGQMTLQVPYKLTMNVESAAASDLQPIVAAYPQLPDDEILALHLMHERSKAFKSFYAPFIASLPTTFDLPLLWSESELDELKGSNVSLLTRLMKERLKRDFKSIHVAIIDEFSYLFSTLPTLSFDDYTWAMIVIWSRAFGITKGGKYLRVLCPAMDMFNHDAKLTNSLDEFISFNEETQMLTHHVPNDVVAGSALMISYGKYSNAKLLYSYGFVANENSRRTLDFWMKIPPTDPFLKIKQTILDTNELTKNQTYDFCGTMFTNDVDERLLATLRVILMNEEEFQSCEKAFNRSILSLRNEVAVYDNLQHACRRKLASFPTTLEEDEKILADIQISTNLRLLSAVQVRAEDKQVLIGVIDTLEQWKHALASNPLVYPPSITRCKVRNDK